MSVLRISCLKYALPLIAFVFFSAQSIYAQEAVHEHQTGVQKAETKTDDTKMTMSGCCGGAMQGMKMDMQGMKMDMQCCKNMGAADKKGGGCCCMNDQQKKPSTKSKVGANTPKIWNEICPVLGNQVNAAVETVSYKNKTIGFCCPACLSQFKADPEKFMQNLNENGKKYIKKT